MPRFVDIPVGTKFTFENNEYVKIPDNRVSCCKVLNAHLVANPNQKVMIVPISDVEVIEQE